MREGCERLLPFAPGLCSSLANSIPPSIEIKTTEFHGQPYLKDGYSWGNAAQDAVLEAQLAVEWALKLIDGKNPPQNIIYDEGQIVTTGNFKEMAPKVWSYSLLK